MVCSRTCVQFETQMSCSNFVLKQISRIAHQYFVICLRILLVPAVSAVPFSRISLQKSHHVLQTTNEPSENKASHLGLNYFSQASSHQLVHDPSNEVESPARRKPSPFPGSWVTWITFPETNIAPQNRPLEKKIPLETIIFRGYVSFREGTQRIFWKTKFAASQRTVRGGPWLATGSCIPVGVWTRKEMFGPGIEMIALSRNTALQIPIVLYMMWYVNVHIYK